MLYKIGNIINRIIAHNFKLSYCNVSSNKLTNEKMISLLRHSALNSRQFYSGVTISPGVFHKKDLLSDFSINSAHKIPLATDILLTTPDHYDVEYIINTHMKPGTVNKTAATLEWEKLKEVYQSLGIRVNLIQSQPNLPDMVYCSNQVLPYLQPDGNHGVVISKMRHPQRQPETKFYKDWFRENCHFRTFDIPSDCGWSFEGMGDAVWTPGRYLLWGGYGLRTDKEVYSFISDRLKVPIIVLRLVNEDFYHLDTCLSFLSEKSALYYPEAFDADTLEMIHHFIEDPIPVSKKDAYNFACNAHCPDTKHVIIHEGSTETESKLREKGFTPIPIQTSEFMKGGGSVFCMKMHFWYLNQLMAKKTAKQMAKSYFTCDELHFTPSAVARSPDPTAFIVVDPVYYQVKYSINPTMRLNIGKVDQANAKIEWNNFLQSLKQERLSNVSYLKPTEDMFDQVFVQDIGLPFINVEGEKCFLKSNFNFRERRNEVHVAEKYFSNLGYKIYNIDPKLSWEGGDLIKIPGRRGYLCGYGTRTDREAIGEIAQVTESPVLGIHLLLDHLFHIDTCVYPLYEDTVIYYPPSISLESVDLLVKFFPHHIIVSRQEANTLALNLLKVDAKIFYNRNSLSDETKQVIMQHGARMNEDLTFVPIELSEFKKGGGSIHCIVKEIYE